MRQDVRKRIHMLLERDNAEEGTESARGLEVVMTAYANVRSCTPWGEIVSCLETRLRVSRHGSGFFPITDSCHG